MSSPDQSLFPAGRALAQFVASTRSLPDHVDQCIQTLVTDGIGTLVAAANPDFPTGQRVVKTVTEFGGAPQSSIIGGAFKTSVVNAALANGTMGYACDLEPHHPEGILHPIAIMIPVALAVGEYAGATGQEFLTAVAVGCEVEYRLSMALGPGEQYNLGFHPSAVCGAFGATAAAASLLKLDAETVARAFGLAACQASGLMAWESEPTENARAFQMGMAARNGVTAAFLARNDFGGPKNVLDTGHTVFHAFSRNPSPENLLRDLGQTWDGVTELAIKPYSSVAFLHPALDALFEMMEEENLSASDIEHLTMRFSRTGVHCVDGNPLKSHCAQYILSVAAVNGVLDVSDIFFDRRETNPEIADLSSRIDVAIDEELEKIFPDFYATILDVRTRNGRNISKRQDIARGYPESPMTEDELSAKFFDLVTRVTTPEHAETIRNTAQALPELTRITDLADLLRDLPAPALQEEAS